ncbi:MAG: dTDP-glucose 4,6-dehydratase [Nitrospirae bacterium]|nr:dTDP-glucose 4,6-dehydratase [Nitrospirota bacterium]MBI5694996.1 dTDP-glucose 4,6-dehydratase [Nitrospirota bacterium]
MPKRILVTGGAGFIGSNFVRLMLSTYPEAEVVNLDALTYAGSLESLRDVEDNPRYRFVKGDVCDPEAVAAAMAGADAVVHFAAESHVDRSIEGPAEFIRTNVMGTQTMLDAAVKFRPSIYVQISTDEVYGSLGPTGLFTETTPLSPNSPYSASKAGADLLALAYMHTFGLPVVVTRCSNNYGPYQFPEKLIPLFINNLLADKPVPLYGDGLNVRDWLHVEDHCRAVDLVMRKGRPGEVYNIGGNNEKANIEITRLILKDLGKPESLISYVKDRLGHDRRYAIDSTKLQAELGWAPVHSFEQGIVDTINWYKENQDWCRKVSGR